jgi:hypothetical protein
VLVMQRRKDLPHQICAPALIAFAQIDANHKDVSRHSWLGAYRFRAR